MRLFDETTPAGQVFTWMGAFMVTVLIATAEMTTAHAQEGGTVMMVPGIVVSASRIALPAEHVGSSVTVLTSEELERRGQAFVSDVLRTVPGLAVNRTGAAGALTAVRIRGTESDHVLVVIDGIEVNDQSAGSSYDFARLMTDDIERIEVVRGPQSALFGSDAIGGVINITTKRGRDGVTGSAHIEGGSFETGDAGAALRYGNEHFNISGTVSHYQTGGISNASEARGNTEADGYTNDTFSLNGGVDPTDWLSLDAAVRATKAFFETDGFAGGTGAFDQDSDTTTNQRYGRLGVTLDPFKGVWTHRIEAAYSSDKDDSRTNRATSSFADGSKRKYGYQTTVSFDTPSAAMAEHDITLLAESEKDTMKASFLRQGKLTTTNNAVAAEYNLGLFESLYLSGSLRYDDNDRFDSVQTHRVSAAYLVDDWGTRFHASHGSGIKNPTLTELFGTTNNFVGNPNLKPEDAVGWDAGIEQHFWNDRARVDVTYFHSDVENLITGSGNTAINLAGVSRARGIEVSGDLALTDQLDVSGSYTWTHAETSDGTEQVRRPTNVASLAVNYRFLENRANLNLGVDFNGTFTDFEFDTAFNRTIVDMSSYTLVNLKGTYTLFDGVDVYARGENLLNEQYEEVWTYGTPGISGYAGVKVEF